LRIIRLATVDSTNLEAKRLVDQGERGPCWIVSAEQTAGKGRLGRGWVSKPGNFYGTLLWPTIAPITAISQVSFVAALAVHETASYFARPSDLALKWPNDCLLDGAKFCGNLCEVIAPQLVAIGIGINIARVPDDLPYRAARLAGTTVESVFEQLQLSLSKYLEMWNNGEGFDPIRENWIKHCPHIGTEISVDGQAGIFTDLGSDGALMLQFASGEVKTIYAGDVRVEYQTKQ
jgi:BirA family transcriptional regulator, biotin operon repressor / biotin---[acetyl-CoA-carboxylase] ligase